MKQLAVDLENQLFMTWLIANKSADDVLRFLRVNLSDENLFNQPRFIRWVKYVRLHAEVEFVRSLALDGNARKELGTKRKAAMKDADKTLREKDVPNDLMKQKNDWTLKHVYGVVISTLQAHFNDDEVRKIVYTGLTLNNEHLWDSAFKELGILDKRMGKRVKRTELPHEG